MKMKGSWILGSFCAITAFSLANVIYMTDLIKKGQFYYYSSFRDDLPTNADKKSSTSDDNVCTANPYLSKLIDSGTTIAQRMDDWLSPARYNESIYQAQTNKTLQQAWNPFGAFQVVTTCDPTERQCVGGSCGNDKSKITCGLRGLQPGCVVYSIGGNNQWEFESSILEHTPCSVHTFDCTGPRSRFTPPAHERLFFHHVCVGAQRRPGAKNPETDCGSRVSRGHCGPTRTLSDLQHNLGHRQIDLYKMDIEGWEWPLLESWPEIVDNQQTTPNATTTNETWSLPMQILVEIHYKTNFKDLWPPHVDKKHRPFKSPAQIVELQARLLRMGYVTIERDDNRACPHCTELTLVRARCPSTPS